MKAIEAGARAALADLVFEAVKFLDWAAGEGIFYTLDNGETVEPDLIIEKAATALGLDDWASLPKLASDTMLSALASGELVPASAVAAEREQCIRAVNDAELVSHDPGECRSHIVRVLRSLSPGPASGGWRDISTAPDDGTEILGCWRGSKTHAIVSWSIDGWWKDNADHCAVSPPTHWMLLPEPPAMLNAATKDGEWR